MKHLKYLVLLFLSFFLFIAYCQNLLTSAKIFTLIMTNLTTIFKWFYAFSFFSPAISLRHAGCLDNLPVSHLRLACATIHFIIESEQLSQFKEAIKLVQQVNQSIPPLVVCQKTYQRLLTGLQIKVSQNSSSEKDVLRSHIFR